MLGCVSPENPYSHGEDGHTFLKNIKQTIMGTVVKLQLHYLHKVVQSSSGESSVGAAMVDCNRKLNFKKHGECFDRAITRQSSRK